ncbi:asparaginase domain-containing protein [Psychrobacter sp. I-STPA10]|uniref:asparaginase domain-containing protein n=1 Tax=Psychrobacter sp. I-STPA10 TaxID=2585769 RepID=UPI001E4F808D|nr:asparaginase domain-containing protein [Psychrobacter sp. I-STPA10]
MPNTQYTTPILSTNPTIQLIYAGGTFGSYGKPLQAIDADVFTPQLLASLPNTLSDNINILPNECVKDSSQLTPSDMVHFYQLLLSAYSDTSNPKRQFVIITGTDTLSYLAAFLAEAFAGSDICIVLTASMSPFFDANILNDYKIDPQSDAFDNLKDAIGLASYGESGVIVAFAGESWPAQTVQKIHSHDLMAFTGHSRAGYPATSYHKQLSALRRQHWIDNQLATHIIIEKAKKINIPLLFCLPNQIQWLTDMFAQTLTQCQAFAPTGIILAGFGAGNIPFSYELAKLMDTAYQQGYMLVCSTQCPFGGVSDSYAAGSWQYQHHVISGGRLTIAAIYARLLWLHLSLNTPKQRRQRWAYSSNLT